MKLKRQLALLSAAVIMVGASLPAYGETYGNSESDSCCILGDEMYFGDMQTKGESGGSQSAMEEIAKEYTPNTVSNERTISAGDFSKLSIVADRCGIAVEPSATGDFSLSYIGVKDAALLSVNTVTKPNGTLELTVQGDRELRYFNSAPEKRVNIVLLKVPTAVKVMWLGADSGMIRVKDLSIPVGGTTGRAQVRIMGDTLEGGYTFGTENGSVILEGGSVGGGIRMTAENGSIKVSGTTIGGSIQMTTENGSAKVNGTDVTGDIKMTTENGKVSITADSVGGAVLEAENGKIELEAGRIIGDVSGTVVNGKIVANLRRTPENLTLAVAGRSKSGKIILPDGWKGDSVFGTGKPKLSLSCENGKVELSNAAVMTDPPSEGGDKANL